MVYLSFIGYRNFRIFKKETIINLAPISLLTGPNNSGKSSILKSLILLNENLKKGFFFDKLEFNSPNHNLGSYKHILNNTNAVINNNIEFTIPVELLIELKGRNKQISRYTDIIENPWIARYEFTSSKNKEVGDLKKLLIYNDVIDPLLCLKRKKSLDDFRFTFELSINIKYILELVEKIIDHDKHYLEVGNYKFDEKYLLFDYYADPEKNKSFVEENFEYLLHIERDILVKKFYKEKVYFSSIDEHLEIYGLEGSELHAILADEICKRTGIWNIKPNKNYDFFYSFLEDLFIESLKANSVLNINYLPSQRGNIGRLFTNLDIDQPFNKLVMQFYCLDLEPLEKGIVFIEKWLQRFGIGQRFIIEQKEGAASFIYIIKDKAKILLADLGFGTTQFISLLMKIAVTGNKERGQILLIEEPESNLHPNFQSLLADMFYEAYSLFHIQFIIETHSEYLIRKFQYLVAKKYIKGKELNIHYFDQNGYSKEINFLEDGRLDKEFGPGFFDEADNLSIELFNLRKTQLN